MNFGAGWVAGGRGLGFVKWGWWWWWDGCGGGMGWVSGEGGGEEEMGMGSFAGEWGRLGGREVDRALLWVWNEGWVGSCSSSGACLEAGELDSMISSSVGFWGGRNRVTSGELGACGRTSSEGAVERMEKRGVGAN